MLCQQALEFGFRFGADAVGESVRVLPMLGTKHGQAHAQVRLVFFQAAQQPLGSGDFFFQCDHGYGESGTQSALSLHCHSAGRMQVASWMLGAHEVLRDFLGCRPDGRIG
jgi:hypothetical protein